MKSWSAHHLYNEATKSLDEKSASSLRRYTLKLQRANLPVIFTLRHLAQIVDVDYGFLRATVN